jgi:RNA polymerase subunit RPABC4/transcription elongation factor Spt4
MGDDEKEYDIERDLEDMKDLLRTEDIDCPNCSSPVSPDADRCPVCGFKIKKAEDGDFENRLKATMWAPGKERGIPMGSDLPPRQTLEAPSEEAEPGPEEEEEPEDLDEIELPDLDEEAEVTVEEDFLVEAMSVRERMKFTISVALVIFGIGFYVMTAIFFTVGYLVLSLMVLGTILVLVGGNLAFDAVLDRKKRETITAKGHLGKAMTSKERLLKPGDVMAKSVWTFVLIAGALSYVLLPIYSTDSIVRFIGMGMGSVMIVIGVSLAFNAFFHERSRKEERKEDVFEALIETEVRGSDFEWACPVCSTPLDEGLDACPKCGAEFED